MDDKTEKRGWKKGRPRPKRDRRKSKIKKFSIYREYFAGDCFIQYQIAWVTYHKGNYYRVIGIESSGEVGILDEIRGTTPVMAQKKLDMFADRKGWRWYGEQEYFLTIEQHDDSSFYWFSV